MSGVHDRGGVVTEAGGGLGRAYAMALGANGAKVVVNDLGGARDGSGGGSEMADAVVAEIRDAGGDAVANYDSVAIEDGAAATVQTAIEQFGAIHGVINNAGILRDSAFHKMSADDFDAVVSVHLRGGFHVTRAAWPHFREQRFGRVVMASSTSGPYGNFGQANYGAAKNGLVGLTNTLASEGGKYDIRVNAIAPMAATRMTADIAPQELLDKLGPEHVAPIVVHLVSDELTESGAVFVVGGGQVSRVQLFVNKGVTFASPPSADEVRQRGADIIDMGDAEPGMNPVGGGNRT